jgi:hypothetical protein
MSKSPPIPSNTHTHIHNTHTLTHTHKHIYIQLSAGLNIPLWKASAIGQSGFQLAGTPHTHAYIPGYLARYLQAMGPPYKGAFATWAGMCWARATIFYGSEKGKEYLAQYGVKGAWAG